MIAEPEIMSSTNEVRIEIFHGATSPAESRVYATCVLPETAGDCPNSASAAVQSGTGSFLQRPRSKNVPVPLAAGHLQLASNTETPWQLTGKLIGPQCAFAHTLPAHMKFASRQGNLPLPPGEGWGEGAASSAPKGRSKAETLLAEAVVPDPCCWTPELPFLYRAQLELRRSRVPGVEVLRAPSGMPDPEVVLQVDCVLGIRRFGVRGKNFYFEGKRFVLRGVSSGTGSFLQWPRSKNVPVPFSDELAPGATAGRAPSAPNGRSSAAEFARETWTALVVPNPSEKFCEFASRQGIFLIADLTNIPPLPLGEGQPALSLSMGGEGDLSSQLYRLSHWPAVPIALLPAGATLPADIHDTAHNLLLAQYFPATSLLEPAPWAQAAFVEVPGATAGLSSSGPEFAHKTAGCCLPIVAVRPAANTQSIEQARADCDTLQSDLAPFGDFAGYIV